MCPSCGYDFPPLPLRRSGIEYSIWANIALVVGAVVASFVCIAFAIGSVVSVFSGQFFYGLVINPVGFFLSLAMFVVFIRVQKL